MPLAQSWVVNPASASAEVISQLFWFTLVLAVVVFLLVEGLLIYSSLRFRRRAPLPAVEPPQMHGNTRLEVMWAAVPAPATDRPVRHYGDWPGRPEPVADQ